MKWLKDNAVGIISILGGLAVITFEMGEQRQKLANVETKIETKIDRKLEELIGEASELKTGQAVMARDLKQISDWIQREDGRSYRPRAATKPFNL